MDVRPHRKIVRKKTREIKVGNISVGGKSIISVQSMTNTHKKKSHGFSMHIHWTGLPVFQLHLLSSVRRTLIYCVN